MHNSTATSTPSSASQTKDTLNIMPLVDEIRKRVVDVIRKRGTTEHSPQDNDLWQINEIVKFKAGIVQSFFDSPAVEVRNTHGFVKPICVICNPNGSIRYVNDAYIEATGIELLVKNGRLNKYVSDGILTQKMLDDRNYVEIIKALSKKDKSVNLTQFESPGKKLMNDEEVVKKTVYISALFMEIYDEETIFNIVNKLRVITQGTGPGYKMLTKMKLTGKTFFWTTLSDEIIMKDGGQRGITTRTAVEYNPSSPTYTQEVGGEYESFGLYKTALRYKERISSIMSSGRSDNTLVDLFNKLIELAVEGDIMIDYSNYPIRWSGGCNREYLRNVPSHTENGMLITLEHLLETFGTDEFTRLVYGDDSEEQKKAKFALAKLLEQGGYTRIFNPRNKLDGRNHIRYTTRRYDSNPNTPQDLSKVGVYYRKEGGKFYQALPGKAPSSNDLEYPMMSWSFGEYVTS